MNVYSSNCDKSVLIMERTMSLKICMSLDSKAFDRERCDLHTKCDATTKSIPQNR